MNASACPYIRARTDLHVHAYLRACISLSMYVYLESVRPCSRTFADVRMYLYAYFDVSAHFHLCICVHTSISQRIYRCAYAYACIPRCVSAFYTCAYVCVCVPRCGSAFTGARMYVYACLHVSAYICNLTVSLRNVRTARSCNLNVCTCAYTPPHTHAHTLTHISGGSQGDIRWAGGARLGYHFSEIDSAPQCVSHSHDRYSLCVCLSLCVCPMCMRVSQ